jgi:hypothetical protein
MYSRVADEVAKGMKRDAIRITMITMVVTMALKGPTLSPMKPVEKRPTHEQAPRIEISM